MNEQRTMHTSPDDSTSVPTNTIQRISVGPVLSEAAIHQGVVYLAGQVADDVTQNIEGQTLQVLAHIDRLLEQAGSNKNKILMCQIYLADIKDFEAMNSVWKNWVAREDAPPRATTQAQLAKPEWLIEMVVTAAQH
jgi:enamine deaminase RidA (YjgF/YER057c/UK114 family)